MVLWRRSLTSYMQKLYIHGHNFYKVEKQEQFIASPRFHCQLCEGGGEIDNPDQRLTSDVSSMLTSYERLMEDDLFILPASTAYYAYKVWGHWVFWHSNILSTESFHIQPFCPGVLCVHVGRAHWNVWALPVILPQQVPDKPGCKENGKARRKVTSWGKIDSHWSGKGTSVTCTQTYGNMPKRWLCRCKEEENYNNQIVIAIILLIALITLVTQGEAEEVLKRSEESLHVVSSKHPFQTNPCLPRCVRLKNNISTQD